ncbi:MAG: autotransporter outer membrane beta-barrel domain-containing protein [Akkermansia sp.]|nr:autotransporter outer membrane beta-barrel domain-containing protein [Akkermansia sp.]
MKLHLPVRLLHAIVALMIAVPALATGYPSDHTQVTVSQQDNLTPYLANDTKAVFIIPATGLTLTNGGIAFGENSSSIWASPTGGALTATGLSGSVFRVPDTSSMAMMQLGNITFKANKLDGGATSDAFGGAIDAGDVTITDNKSAVFTGNCITADNTTGYMYGGAGLSAHNSLTIQNNESVIFEKNYLRFGDETYLQGLYTHTAAAITLSAPEGGSIEFRDAVNTHSTVLHVNPVYINAAGESIAQTGDIILNGAYAEQHLKEIREAEGITTPLTEEEIAISREHYMEDTTIEVHDGRLIVKESTLLSKGVEVHSSPNSTPTLKLEDACMESSSSSAWIQVRDGAALELSGNNKTTDTHIQMDEGSTLAVNVSDTQKETAALEVHNGNFNTGNTLTLQVAPGAQVVKAGQYKVLDLVGNATLQPVTIQLTGMSVDVELTSTSIILTLKEDFNILTNLTRNERAVHTAATQATNSGGMLGELSTLATTTLDEQELRSVLRELGGEEYSVSMSGQIGGNMGHMRRMRAAVGHSNQLTEFSHSYMSGKSAPLATNPLEDARRWRAGLITFHEENDIDGNRDTEGFDRTDTGAQLLVENRLRDNLTLGAGLALSRTKVSPENGRSRHEDNTHFDLYGVYTKGRWNSVTALGLGLHDHDMKRNVAGGTTEASADGYSINFLQELAYAAWRSNRNELQVFGALETSFNHIDSFTEKGAGNASLRVDSQEAWGTDLTVGTRYNRILPQLGSAPAGIFSAQAGVVASIGDTKDTIRMGFVGTPGTTFTQHGASRDRWGLNLGVSVTLPVSSRTSLFASGDAVWRENSTSADGQIGVKIAF